MAYIDYGTEEKYRAAILVKDSILSKEQVYNYYIEDLVELGMTKEDIIVVGLPYDTQDKVSNKSIKENIDKLFTNLRKKGVKYVMVADSKYFVPVAGLKKVSNSHGYRFNCALPGHEDFVVTLGVNYGSVLYNPSMINKLKLCNKAFADIYLGIYKEPGKTAVEKSVILESVGDIHEYLYSLHKQSVITCDIEAFDLKFWKSGIGTIAFATSPTEGAGFRVDYENLSLKPLPGIYGKNNPNSEHAKSVRALLVDFFMSYRGKVFYHGISFDAKVLAFQLFLSDYRKDFIPAIEREKAVAIMLRQAHCTKVLAYLCTNNCAENSLKLKDQAQEVYGNWAQDEINDIRKIPLDELLEYNIVDACATYYLKTKYWDKLEEENQKDVYEELYVPFYDVGINTELNGMPLSYSTVTKNKKILEDRIEKMGEKLKDYQNISTVTHSIKLLKKVADDKKLKTKERSLDELSHIQFNPNSSAHQISLVYDLWKEPVLEKTDKGLPSTKGAVLEGILKKYCSAHNLKQENEYRDSNNKTVEEYTERAQILHLLIQIKRADKIVNTFFRAFTEGRKIKDKDIIFLHGNLNSTGTKSGRLSSSDPNLQNIPSNAALAKLVKEAFISFPGYIFGGADFSSLEDRISALTTKDPNKLKVYTDGYDGHCLRAFNYFGHLMPDIDDESDIDLINSIADKYPDLRQDSKAPTFLLTYQGTYIGMMKNCGFTEETAKSIEANYHDMYKVSDQWVNAKLKEAAKVGYVTLAFGLKLRTPLLQRYKYKGNKAILPKAAQKELRTAGNALGQSYCLLNNRAAIEFTRRLRKSPYLDKVFTCCFIHDAIYLYWKDDIEITEWVNKNLTECMAWQELPEIQHPEVKLSGELDLFYPNWGNAITLPNKVKASEIKAIVKKALIG